eukprot:2627410-Rhodomonas_salina.1
MCVVSAEHTQYRARRSIQPHAMSVPKTTHPFGAGADRAGDLAAVGVEEAPFHKGRGQPVGRPLLLAPAPSSVPDTAGPHAQHRTCRGVSLCVALCFCVSLCVAVRRCIAVSQCIAVHRSVCVRARFDEEALGGSEAGAT